MTEEVKENAAVEGSDAKNDSAMDTTAEATEKKEGDETETPAGEGDEEQKEEDKAAKKGFRYRDGANATADEHSNSPYLRVKNRNLIAALSENLEKSQASLKEIFTDTLGVAIPKVKLPMVTHLYVEMASLEDKFKVLSNTPRPERWNSNKKLSPTAVITQSVVVRDETLPPAEKGTLEEALEELLPLRKMLYKDQLDLKFKELDANVDNAVEVTNIVLAKGKRKKIESVSKLTKPPVDSIVPMIPNVGYDRNVILNLEKDASGKLIPGIRVTYEKDEVKKRFLLPVSECTHIAPQIVKAAQELCAHLSSGNVKVFDGVEENADIYSLKFTMNDIGEIIISVVLVLKDYFDEFFDLMENDALSQQVADYFEVIKTKGKQQIIKEANENGGDVAELNGDEDAANEEEEEEEKAEETAKTSEEKDESADKPAEEEKKDEEKKDEEVKAADDDDISILREGARRSIPLKKCPNLSRMEPVMREQLNRFSPELKKFFEEKGTTLGVTGVFITWYIVNKLPTDFSRNLKYWYHVCGNESVTETVNNVKLELIPHLEFLHPSRPQVVPMIMNVLTDALGIDSNSRAVVASDYHMVQSFFAQKCNKTMFLTYQNEAMKNDVKRKHRDRVTCVSGKTKHTNIIEKCKQFFSDLPNIVVHWGAYRENAIKALFLHRVAKVAIIFDPQENITFRNHGSSAEIIKKLNCSLHPQYTLKKIIGIDVGPLKKGPVTVIAIYETVPGFFNMNRGIKRKGPMYGGPNSNKRPMQGNRQMNDRFGDRRRGGMGGGGYGNKRQRMDDNNRRPPQPLLAARGGGPNRSRFNQRPPHPWNDNRRFEPYNGRGGGGGGFNNQGGPQEPTVQAAKAVLSQLNSIIENQLMLAQIKSGPDPNQNRGRPNDGGWVGGNRRDDFGGNRDGPSSFANDQDYFSRDRSPPTYGGGGNRGFNDNRGGGGGFNDNAGRNYGGGGNLNRNFGGGDSNRGFGGGDMNRRVGGGGMGGGGSGGGMNRRNMGGGGGGGGGGAGKPFRFNNRRN